MQKGIIWCKSYDGWPINPFAFIANNNQAPSFKPKCGSSQALFVWFGIAEAESCRKDGKLDQENFATCLAVANHGDADFQFAVFLMYDIGIGYNSRL
jgi:hypothetical protein